MDPVSDHKSQPIRPRIIIHGGAGNITRDTLPAPSYQAYRHALLDILHRAQSRLQTCAANSSALEVATYAVALLEDCPLFNAGRGAVYTRAGTHELEASVMVSHGARKRGVGVMQVARAKNPILLAKEMLLRGERADGGGAQGHCQLAGATCDRLAEEWGLELVAPSYFWTKKRWDEHRRGLGLGHSQEEYDKMKREADAARCVREVGQLRTIAVSDDPSWDEHEYLPQGTVGAVVLDSQGVVAVATSTGGLTNKLPGRIGDTPTIGAGFFAEQWDITAPIPPAPSLFDTLSGAVGSCLPNLAGYSRLPTRSYGARPYAATSTRAVAMSGTGNGDSFLRLSAVRTAAAMARFTSVQNSALSHPRKDLLSLQEAVSAVAGPNGTLQRSAGDRWRKTGEGEGGIIGIDLVDGVGRVVFDFNCGGMFRAWYDDQGKARMMVLREEY